MSSLPSLKPSDLNNKSYSFEENVTELQTRIGELNARKVFCHWSHYCAAAAISTTIIAGVALAILGFYVIAACCVVPLVLQSIGFHYLRRFTPLKMPEELAAGLKTLVDEIGKEGVQLIESVEKLTGKSEGDEAAYQKQFEQTNKKLAEAQTQLSQLDTLVKTAKVFDTINQRILSTVSIEKIEKYLRDNGYHSYVGTLHSTQGTLQNTKDEAKGSIVELAELLNRFQILFLSCKAELSRLESSVTNLGRKLKARRGTGSGSSGDESDCSSTGATPLPVKMAKMDAQISMAIKDLDKQHDQATKYLATLTSSNSNDGTLTVNIPSGRREHKIERVPA